MVCRKCKSENVTVNENFVVKSKRRSFLWNLFMLCITCGLWLVWMAVRKRKEKVVKIKSVICNNCGYSWEI